MIVDKSADVDYAAAKAPMSSFFNSGQVCIRADYAFVHESILDEFMKKAIAYAEEQFQGGKLKQLGGKVINEASYNRICDLLDPADH